MLRKLAVLLCLALLPSLASAEVIRYIAPGGTFTGGTITSPILAPAAPNCGTPPYSFSGDTSSGLCTDFASWPSIRSAGAETVAFSTSGPKIHGTMALQWGSGNPTTGGASDLFLYRDAANTLGIRNSSSGNQTNEMRVYGHYVDPSNNSYFSIKGINGDITLTTAGGGSGGTGAAWHISSGANYLWLDANMYPVNGNVQFGYTAAPFKAVFLAEGIQGGRTKTLTESSATTFVTVAVPQTAGANYASGKVIYTVYATDGTDSQSLNGEAQFSAVNKAGTETCAPIADIQTSAAASAGTLTCTLTCVTGLTDVVGIAANCVSSLTQTTLTIQARLDMPQPNTLVFP